MRNDRMVEDKAVDAAEPHLAGPKPGTKASPEETETLVPVGVTAIRPSLCCPSRDTVALGPENTASRQSNTEH